MATEIDLVELTRVQMADEANRTIQPSPMQSISRFFKHNRDKDYASDSENLKRLQEAVRTHDMDLVKQQLLLKCPLLSECMFCYSLRTMDSIPGLSNPTLGKITSKYSFQNAYLACMHKRSMGNCNSGVKSHLRDSSGG